MELQLTNREIFFAVESVWNDLPFKFQVQLFGKVSENSADDFVQTVEIDAETFVKVMLATNAQPQGVAKDINPAMHLNLKNQILLKAMPVLQQLSQLSDEAEILAFKESNAEILIIAERVQSILNTNLEKLEAKLLNGKTQILGL